MIVLILKHNTVSFILNADGTYTVLILPDMKAITTATHAEVLEAIEYFKRDSSVQVVYE